MFDYILEAPQKEESQIFFYIIFILVNGPNTGPNTGPILIWKTFIERRFF